MSVVSKDKPVTVHSLQRKKAKGEKIVSLTAYDYTTARILDEAGVDFMLVGDSLAMTMLGHPNTLSVTVDEMIHHTKAVVRGAKRALVVADMPFMSYTVSVEKALENAGRFMQEGQCAAVKLEGAHPDTLAAIEHMTRIGIPVMGHLGFTPQSINTMGGYKVQGKSLDDARKLLKEAKALQKAGVFAVVLEMVPSEVATVVTEVLAVPTIGIGAGAACDGQILVVDDLLGRYQELTPRFVRQYMDSATLIHQAVRQYRQDIQTGSFPSEENEAFHLPEEQTGLVREKMLEGPVFDYHPEEPVIKRVI